MVLEAAVKEGLIEQEEADRQINMLQMATKIEKTRGMAQGEYIRPSFGDDLVEVANKLIDALKNGKKVAMVINSKKETTYLFSDVIKLPYDEINPDNKPVVIANLDENIGLPRIRNHATNITNELKENGIEIDYLTGGLDEYPATAKKAAEIIKELGIEFIVVVGVPHALPIEELDVESVAVTDGPRIVEPLRRLGYTNVIAELDAHSKTLGTSKIVESDFGNAIREEINK
jgi:putative methanogenesis marker 13 metalloprotein